MKIEKRDAIVYVRLKPSTKAWLEALAKEYEISVSNLMEILLEEKKVLAKMKAR